MTAVSIKPHVCVILSVDPGATSGWAVAWHQTSEREPICVPLSGCARDAEMRRVAVHRAVAEANMLDEPLVVVAEKWTAHGAFGGARTQRGLGAAWGRWAEQIEAAGIPKRRIVRVYPASWQGAILSAGGHGWTRERREAASIAYVSRRFGIDCGADEAAAICIGVWAMHAGEVGAVLPKRKRKRSSLCDALAHTTQRDEIIEAITGRRRGLPVRRLVAERRRRARRAEAQGRRR